MKSCEAGKHVLPVLQCSGSPKALGEAQGEAFRGQIQALIAQRLDALRGYFAERQQSYDEAQLWGTARGCLDVLERWDPEGYLEHLGVSEAAGVSPIHLHAVANMTDVRDILLLGDRADAEGCTAFVAPRLATMEGQIMAGQTWDLNPADLSYVVAVQRAPLEKPKTWSITCVGCPSLISINEVGIAAGTTNIKAYGSRVGIGYLNLLHRLMACTDLSSARRVIDEAPRAAAHTYWVASETGAFDAECTATECAWRNLSDAALIRTNHMLQLGIHEAEPPTESSLQRLETVGLQLSHDQLTLEGARALLADRSCGFNSICRYPEDEQGTSTNACVIALPYRRTLWACRGPADHGAWAELCFS